MGQVFEVWDANLDRMLALKVLAHQGPREEELRLRFAREARLQARIRHPHLVQIFEVQLEGPVPYLAMERVRGQDLECLRERRGPLGEARLVRLAREVGSALDRLHEESVVHRDLKPANVMVRNRGGNAVLMDLGLARDLQATVFTREGAFVGTPRFLAPEVVCDGDWTPRGDQWQLAASLFVLATGRHLVPGGTLEEILVNLQRGRWEEWPRELPVSEGFRVALERAAAHDPEERFPSCGAFAEALAGASNGHFAGSLPGSPPGRTPGAPPELAPGSASARSAGTGPDSGGIPASLRPWIPRGAMLLLLGLALWLALGTGNPPRDLELDVVGDVVRLRARGEGPLWLEVDGVRSEVPCAPGGGACRGERRDLAPGRAVGVRAIWPGGASPAVDLLPEPPALGDRVELRRGHHLGLELRRSLRLLPLSEGGEPRVRGPGPALLPAPGPHEGPFVLRYQDRGVSFTRELDWETLLARALERVREEAHPERVRALGREARRGGREEAGELTTVAALWRDLGDWVPDLLGAALPRGERWGLYRAFECWRQEELLRHAGGGPPPAPGLAWGLAGSRRRGIPLGRRLHDLTPSLEVDREAPHSRLPQGLVLNMVSPLPYHADLGTRTGARALHFAWPEIPEDLEHVWISLWADNMDHSGKLRLETEEAGNGMRVEFWPEAGALVARRPHSGWTQLVLPRDLLPAPGSPVTLTYRHLAEEVGGWVVIRRLLLHASPRERGQPPRSRTGLPAELLPPQRVGRRARP